MPKLKLKVENAIHGYLIDELTDEEFKESIQSILDEFEGKNLLHQNRAVNLGMGKEELEQKEQV